MEQHQKTDTKLDELAGRAKEAAGALTGDDELKQEGEQDQVAADAKGVIDRVADGVKDGIDDVKDAIRS